jgi:hypothetical protein
MNNDHPISRRDYTIMEKATSATENGWEKAKGAVCDSIESAKDFGGNVTEKTVSAAGDTYLKTRGEYTIMENATATSVTEKGRERVTKGVVGDSIESAKHFGGDVADNIVSATGDTYKKAKGALPDASWSAKESFSGAASSAEESGSVSLKTAEAEDKAKSALDMAYELFGDQASTDRG